jgi:UDP-2,3-diacylglucosamine pyrophosphatase LpxH
MKKRELDLLVISDVHLGTFGCRAEQLLHYLNSIQPQTIVLNGDIIDAWQFKKRKFTSAHLAVLQKILEMSLEGTKTYYLCGNHDEFLRRYAPLRLENFIIDNKLVLEMNGERIWFFHGDIFDTSVTCSKWLAKLGAVGYDLLIWLNHHINKALTLLNRPRMSLSKKIKEGVKRAVKYISDFEQVAAELAIAEGYDTVVCGHIHMPQQRRIYDKQGRSVQYLNSGDWVENLSALEYNNGKWTIYKHDELSTSSELRKIEIPEYEELMASLTIQTEAAAIVNMDIV